MKGDHPLQSLREPTKVFEDHDMNVEPQSREPSPEVVKYPLHPSVIEVLDDMDYTCPF